MATRTLSSDLYKALARALYLATGLIILLWFSYQIAVVLMATLLALILAIALNAPVTMLEKRGVSRPLGLGLSFLAVMGVLGGIGWLVIPRLAEELPRLIEQVPSLVEQFSAWALQTFGDVGDLSRQLDRLVDWVFGLIEGLWGYADVAVQGLLLGIFVLALVLYMVANLRTLLAWYTRSMPAHLRQPAAHAFARTSRMVIGWIVASVILGAIKAVAAFLFLTLMGIPGAIIWATIAFFGAFIPRVGFYMMTLPPVLVAFSVSPMAAVWTLVFYVVFSEFLGNFVAPRIYAETMDLNPVYVLFMTIALGYAFGVIGVLISAPVAGMLKAYYDAFYLEQQPEDPQLEERVDAMMRRDPEAVPVRQPRVLAGPEVSAEPDAA